jgi:hypothetical protein
MCARKGENKVMVLTEKVWDKKKGSGGGGVEGRPFAKRLREGKDERKREGREGDWCWEGRRKTVSHFELHLS